MSTIGWQPILRGELAARAREHIAAIADELWLYRDAPKPGAVADSRPGARGWRDPLSALLYGYSWAQERDSAELEERAMFFLERGVSTLATQAIGPALFGGFSGVGWLDAHFSRQWPSDDEEPELDDDNELLRGLLTYLRRGESKLYDLISGYAGFGVYALECAESALRREVLETIVAILSERAVDGKPGLTWPTPPETLSPAKRAASPNGCFNLGLAHGVPGIAGLLARIVDAGVATDRAHRLLDGCVTWLLARRVESAPRGGGYGTELRAPDEVGDGVARVAWCYGGLGVAAAIALAADTTGNESWRRAALEIAVAEARVPIAGSGVADAALCHGAVGNAHIFNRLFQYSSIEELGDAAIAYYERALGLHRDGDGIAGYPAWAVGRETGNLQWLTDYCVLTGAAGIALGLLASVSHIDPAWDRLLMTCLPPREGRSAVVGGEGPA